MTRNPDEVARWFAAVDASGGANFVDEVFPGLPAAVVASGELRRMTWGFPYAAKGRNGQTLKPRPINNARTDKLKSFFWRDSFENRRCLIPVEAFAEAEGAKGAKTRTWMHVPDQKMMAMAGIWRETAEWGSAYSMVMTDASPAMADVHDRMPVIIAREDWELWIEGSPSSAFDLCRPWQGPLVIDRTDRPWTRSR